MRRAAGSAAITAMRSQVFFFFIKTHNCTLLALHTSLTVVTILTMLTMLPLSQFILLTYNIYFTEVNNRQHITDTVQILQLEIDSTEFE